MSTNKSQTKICSKYLRAFQLFRALLPSWKFFDQIGYTPELYYRTGSNEQNLSPWFKAIKISKRRASGLFLNSQENLQHALYSLLEQVVSDTQDLSDQEDISKTVSYKLIHEFIRNLVVKNKIPERYQFKISFLRPETMVESASGGGNSSTPNQVKEDDLLISPVYRNTVGSEQYEH